MYAGVNSGIKIAIPSQEPWADIQPGVVYVDGGHNDTPIYIYYGVGSRFYGYGDNMHAQALAKLSGDTNGVFYDGTEHPKPQLPYWNDITKTHALMVECHYPMAGEMYKWFSSEGEPKFVCVWEEVQGDVTALADTNYFIHRSVRRGKNSGLQYSRSKDQNVS